MLGEKYKIDLKIGKFERELSFNFQFLKNLNSFMNVHPLYYLQEFLGADNRDDYLATILYCMCDADITLSDIDEVLEDQEIKNNLTIQFITMINLDLRVEFEEEIKEACNNEKDDMVKELSNEEKLKQFEQYWNYYYYVAIIQLHKTYKEFMVSSPREIKTLDKFNSMYSKNVLIGVYSDIIRARSVLTNNEAEQEEVITVNRVRDLFK